MLPKPWPEVLPSSITTTTASSTSFSPMGPTSTRSRKILPNIPIAFLKNDGHGHFTDVTQKAGLAGTGFDMGVAIGDYDNDGYEDIFVTGVYHNTLYHNNGNGTFTDVTAKAGLNKPDAEYGPLWSVAAAWVDVNNDGLLDLVVINYLKWDAKTEPDCEVFGHRDYCHPKMYKPTPNQLFINKGDGTFRDASVESGLRAQPGKGMGVAAADFSLDGRMDLFVPNDKLVNFFFRNQGNGKFAESRLRGWRLSAGRWHFYFWHGS